MMSKYRIVERRESTGEEQVSSSEVLSYSSPRMPLVIVHWIGDSLPNASDWHDALVDQISIGDDNDGPLVLQEAQLPNGVGTSDGDVLWLDIHPEEEQSLEQTFVEL